MVAINNINLRIYMSLKSYFAEMNLLRKRGVFTVFVMLLTVSWLSGQISISSSSFPVDGDTIFYKTNNYPDKRVLTAIGKNAVWDYSDLRSPFISVVNFKKNTEVIGDVGGGTAVYEDGELRYLVNNNMKIVAASSDLISGKVKTYSEYLTLVPSSLKYKDQIFHNAVSEEIFEQNEIPTTLQKKLSKILLPLKITTNTITRGEVASSGTLILPWGAEEVLMAKMEITENLECTYMDEGSWKPLNEEQKGFLDLDYKKTKTEFHFYSKNSKLPLMIINWSPLGGPESIKYQVQEASSRDIKRGSDVKEIVAFPNPTFGNTKFEFLNYEAGTYTLEIYAVYGAKLWSETYELQENDIISENFSFLRKGTYLYCIKNKQGAKIVTKRLVIITP